MALDTGASTRNTWKQSFRGWVVVACGGLFYMYQFIVRVSPNIMNDELMLHLSIDAAVLGTIVGVYYWAYAAMQLPLGATMDRLGPRFFLCGASFLCAFASFLFGYTSNPYIAGIARFLMGMGSSCGLIGTIKLGTIWLEPKYVAKVTALTMLFGTVGAGIGGAPMKLVLNAYGLQQTMNLLALLGIVIGIIIYFMVHNHPKVDHHEELPDLYANTNPFTDIMRLIKCRQAWVVAVYGMLMYLPITTIGVAWGVPFIERACQTTETIAASVVSTMFLGAAVGSPFFAVFSDFLKQRRLPMFIGSLLTSAIWFIILCNEGLSITIMYALFFAAGFAYTAKCLTFASICEMMPRNMSGISLAFINMVVMTTGIIFHPLIGGLINYNWDGQFLQNGVPDYTVADFRFALMVIPICLVVSGFLLKLMKESHPEYVLPREYGPVLDTDVL